ncbi:cytochrome c [Povalibacter sp.]|uniref:c-type cytochrome n=1 Tax=Povalibacter sp. TaxID=1962978 RepID=UPI002F4064A6
MCSRFRNRDPDHEEGNEQIRADTQRAAGPTLGLALIVPLLLLALTACTTTDTPEREIHQLSGTEIYARLCFSCHGPSGQGDGPVSSLIAIGVPDLTRIAQRNGGEFPTEDVQRTIDGRWDRRAHGARDMPVWGWQLYDASSENDVEERAQADSMIDRLVGYLRSIQVE